MRNLTESELELVDTLGTAWSQFNRLPNIHPDHPAEFRRAIHTLQDLIMSRPAVEQYGFLRRYEGSEQDGEN